MLKIRLYGDPCLRQTCEPVQIVGSAERMLVQAMLETMYENKGIGLAAPQVGINRSFFVADTGDRPIAVFNPEVVKKSGSAEMEEGCLSIPGVNVVVKRPSQIVFRYTDENNERVEEVMNDLLARVCLHETDHLLGKLIVDYAGLVERQAINPRLKELEALSRKKEDA